MMAPKATIKEKVKVILFKEKYPSIRSQDITEKFDVGRIQIQNILKRKAEIKSDFENNQLLARKQHLHYCFQSN